MATKFKSRSAVIVRTKSPTVSKANFESLKTRAAAATKRLRSASQDDSSAAIGVVSGIGLAMYEKSGAKLPTLFGIDPALVWGPAAWFLTRGATSDAGRFVHAAGLSWTTIGANRSASRGSMRVAGEDDGDDYADDSDL